MAKTHLVRHAGLGEAAFRALMWAAVAANADVQASKAAARSTKK